MFPSRRWSREADGLAWLLASSGVIVVSGWLLQVLAIHRLDAAAYATFIFGLGIGSIAAVLGSAIQPIVATARLKAGSGSGLPATPVPLVAVCLAVAIGIATPGVGFAAACLCIAQLPLSLAVGIVSGELQAQRSYRALSLAAAAWTGARVLIAGAGALLVGAPWGFLACLPFALAVQLASLLYASRHRRRIGWPVVRQAGGTQWGLLVAWGLLAWLVYGDAVMARIALSSTEAADYGVAQTLGRQATYLAAPLATVILPAAAAAALPEARRITGLMLMATGAVLAVTTATLGVAPGLMSRLLLHAEAGSHEAIRLYALAGTAGFSVLLSASFLTGAGNRIDTRALAAISALSIAAVAGLVHSAAGLAAVQSITVAVTAGLLLARCAMYVRRGVARPRAVSGPFNPPVNL